MADHPSIDRTAVMPMVAASTARIGPWLTLQRADQQRRIADAIAEGARQRTTARGVEIPSPALLAVGCRPGSGSI